MSVYRFELPLALWMEMHAYAGVMGISIEALLYQVLEVALEGDASCEDADAAEADDADDSATDDTALDDAEECFYCADGLAPV